MTPSHLVNPDKNFKPVAYLQNMTFSRLREVPVAEKLVFARE